MIENGSARIRESTAGAEARYQRKSNTPQSSQHARDYRLVEIY